MNQEALIIAKSILELKQENDVIKDYLFPFFVAFFSALLGAGVAYIFNKRHERFRVERERFDLANKILTDAVSGLNCLVSIKSNYLGLTSSDPLKRAFEVPIILMNERLLNVDVSRYYFIGPVQTSNFTFKQKFVRWINYKVIHVKPFQPTTEELGRSWRNLMRISAFVSNYNYILTTLEKRNRLNEEIKEDIQKACEVYGYNPRKVTLDFVCKHIDGAKISQHVHLTEFLIALLDHVLKEMDSFVTQFPEIAESNIEMKMIGSRAKVVRIINDRPAYLASLIPIKSPDYVRLSAIVGRDLKETKLVYTFSDWY